jgi:murein DD-endopeptidase MepM/ murein hydrolase activator NlpD
VRPFPRTPSHPLPERRTPFRTAAVCATLTLATVTAVMPLAVADDKLRHKQRQAHGQVRSAQGDLHESSKALVAAAKRLNRARAVLTRAQRRLAVAQKHADAAARVDAQMQRRLQLAESRLAAARVALDAARQKVREQRIAIGRLAASNYANGDPALMGLSVMLTSQDPAEVTTQMNTVTSLMSRQTTLLEELKIARAQMVAEEAKVEKARAEVAVQRRAARANLVRKQGLERTAAQARAQVATLVARRRAAEGQASRARAADMRQLRAAKRQEQKIRRLIMQRSRKQRGGGYSGNTGGFLHRPVPGEVTSPYGYRRHPIYGYWGLHDGTDFRAGCGTPERAGRSGVVISRVWSDVYGNRLYLDVGRVNGKNMTLVYNHMSSYAAGTGERVSRGETVGYSGSTGWSTGCHLHFTVLLNGNPVNPMNYM